MKAILSMLLLIAIFLVIYSMTTGEEPKNKISQNEEAYNACIDSGGIPILSDWSSRLTDCLFPPEKEEDAPFEMKELIT